MFASMFKYIFMPFGIFFVLLAPQVKSQVRYVSKVWSLMLKLVETIVSNTRCPNKRTKWFYQSIKKLIPWKLSLYSQKNDF